VKPALHANVAKLPELSAAENATVPWVGADGAVIHEFAVHVGVLDAVGQAVPSVVASHVTVVSPD